MPPELSRCVWFRGEVAGVPVARSRCGLSFSLRYCQWVSSLGLGTNVVIWVCDPEAVPDGIRFRVTSFRVLIQNKNWMPIIWLFDMR